MGKVANDFKSFWESCLLEHHHLNNNQRRGLMRWLLGENMGKFDNLTTEELASTAHAITNRYQILRSHYLGVEPKLAYRNLFNRFGRVMIKYPRLHHWITSSQEHQKTLVKTFEGMIEQSLRVDPYLRASQNQIALCTEDLSLRNALLLATIEEYCLHSINHYPLLFHLLYHFLLHQHKKQQITDQQQKLLQLLCEEIQQQPFNTHSQANFSSSPLQQQMGKIAFEQALKSYVELQLVS